MDVPTTTWLGHRDHLLLTLMFNTGARVSEIIGIRVADVLLGPTSCVRLQGKGRTQRSLPLWKTTAHEVRDWLRLNPQLQPGSALLPRRDGEPMTRVNVTQRLKSAVAAASAMHPELTKMTVSPHVIRHSTAMGLLRAGTHVTDIALWLGHESPFTTHMYVEAGLAMKERTLALAQAAQRQAGPISVTQGVAAVPSSAVIMRSANTTSGRLRRARSLLASSVSC